MIVEIPDIYKQINKEEIRKVIEDKYSTLGPLWVGHQMEWINGVYASFKDHDKFLIIIYLIKKTLDFYSRNFIKLNYDQFYSKDTVEIEKINLMEISLALNIPKETTRRKVLELENLGAINKRKKNIIIDRSKFYYSKPIKSIKRISRFLSTLSEICEDEKILKKKINTEKLELVIKDNFSYIWKVYYDLQIPTLLNYKKIFKDLDTFHIMGTCIVNQHLYAKKIAENYIDRDNFFKSIHTALGMQGLNAMSIADITGIPRATVMRKLKKTIKLNILKIDDKKHYRLKGDSFWLNHLKPVQNDALIKLAYFSSIIFNQKILNE